MYENVLYSIFIMHFQLSEVHLEYFKHSFFQGDTEEEKVKIYANALLAYTVLSHASTQLKVKLHPVKMHFAPQKKHMQSKFISSPLGLCCHLNSTLELS